MIRLKDLTPEVYYKESRDFQFIGRLFDVVLNSAKTEVDLMYNIPLSDDSNEKLLELMALTLGFKPKHQYNTRQLKAICKVFPEILRNKGSIKSIIIACNALFNAASAEQALDYDFTRGSNNTELNIYVPQDFKDITVIADLLDYILPAGMSCNIIRELQLKTASTTELETRDVITVYNAGDTTGFNTTTDTILYSNESMSGLVDLLITEAEEKDEEEDSIITYKADNKFLEAAVEDKAGYIMNSTLYTVDSQNLNEVEQETEGE